MFKPGCLEGPQWRARPSRWFAALAPGRPTWKRVLGHLTADHAGCSISPNDIAILVTLTLKSGYFDGSSYSNLLKTLFSCSSISILGNPFGPKSYTQSCGHLAGHSSCHGSRRLGGPAPSPGSWPPAAQRGHSSSPLPAPGGFHQGIG